MKYLKVALVGIAAYVACVIAGCMALPFNQMLADVTMSIGMIVMLACFCLILFWLIEIIFDSAHEKSYEDEIFKCADFDDVTDDMLVEAHNVEKICDTLEKIASTSGDGTFDQQNIMLDAIDFRERAAVIRNRRDVLVKARYNQKFEGVKDLTTTYSNEDMFNGFKETIKTYLPEVFDNPKYTNVDEHLSEIYKRLYELCDRQTR